MFQPAHQTDDRGGTAAAAFSWAHGVASRSRTAPDATAFLYLRDGEHETERLTYAELQRRAASVGAWLRQAGFSGKRALVLHQPGVEFVTAFLGCLAARTVAVPVFPPNPARPDASLTRLLGVVTDCSPAVVLVSSALWLKITALADQWPALRALPWIDTSTIPNAPDAEWDVAPPDAPDVAFLQYTSGSTHAPKGVRITHRNITANARRVASLLSLTPDSRGLSWLPPYHDMGLIGHVLQPLCHGIESILMPPVAVLQRPLRWLEAISRYRATISYAPNFAYELVLRKVRPEHLARLDLSCWTSAGCGAEPIQAATLERFYATFAACGFRREAFCPSYGLAECTLLATGHHGTASRSISKTALEQHVAIPVTPASPDARVVMSVGRAGDGMELVVVDPDSCGALPEGRVGEVWLRGDSVADGYFERPEETEATFGARLASAMGRVNDSGDGPYLRTGDLGFVADGNLHITGRLKDLIVVDGKNHYPQDVEHTVAAALPARRAGAVIAFSVESDGTERLVVVAEQPRGDMLGASPDVLITTAIAEQHGLRLHALVFVAPGSLPKTGSGKPRRRACRAAYLDGTLRDPALTP